MQALDTTPPVREVWRLGLVNAARQTNNYHGPETALGQRLAVSYSPDFPAGGTGDVTWDVCDSDGSNITWPGSASEADPLLFVPWGIGQYKSCSVLGSDVAGAVGSTVATLAARSSHLVEQVLWTGLLDVGTDIETVAAAHTPVADNVRLASSAATLIDGTGAHDLTVALGLINEWAADTVGPYRVWIHAESRLTPSMAFYGQATRTDNGLSASQNVGDHRFVFGTGYTGASDELTAATDESWLVVTNPVRVAEGPIDPVPGGDPSQFVDRARNKVRVHARRAVLAEWDTTVHAAIKVCLPGPGPACE